jgi:two-component system, sensor histidine kinase and response regulator
MNAQSQNNGSILVADDTAENLRLLTNMLGNKGFEIRPVTSGRQALQAAERSAPDLILLDITMPEMDGYEVCRRLKEQAALRDIPVIFLTALTETADKLKAFGIGGVDYISKPFQIDEVLARARVHIALRRAQKELAESYERLRELEKVRDHLVHLIVHDMRSPLSVIMGNLEYIQMLLADAPSTDIADAVDAAAKGVRNLTGMTNDLLDVSKLEEGKMPLKLESCDVVALAREVAEGISKLDPTRTITVDGDAPVRASCDAGIVRRIFQNLLSNAIKHTPDGSSVRVTAAEARDKIRVSVIDSGRGVPPEAREKIFEKFGAVETRTDRKYHSVGLGLAFCKLAVEAHGGKIGVDGGEKGGSVFWFELSSGAK